MNMYILDDTVAELRRLMLMAGWRLPEDQYDIGCFLSAMQTAASSSDVLRELIRQPPTLSALLMLATEFSQRGVGRAELDALIDIHNWCTQRNVNTISLKRFINEVQHFEKLGVSIIDAANFMRQAFALSSTENWSCSPEQMLKAVAAINTLEEQRMRLDVERERLRYEIQALRMQKDILQPEITG